MACRTVELDFTQHYVKGCIRRLILELQHWEGLPNDLDPEGRDEFIQVFRQLGRFAQTKFVECCEMNNKLHEIVDKSWIRRQAKSKRFLMTDV